MASIPPSQTFIPSSPSTGKSLAQPPRTLINPTVNSKPIATFSIATAAAALILTTSASSLSASIPFNTYYGTAASAANYGGYGGNSSKKDSAEYLYSVPETWKEHLVSKIEKGTNGTDSEFYNPKKKSEREYLTFLAGFTKLPPIDVVLNNVALSDVDLQDLIATADRVTSEEKKDENGQLYYVYEIDGVGSHSLITVTCARNKLYAHFVNAPAAEWNRDKEMLKEVHESFRTVNSS